MTRAVASAGAERNSGADPQGGGQLEIGDGRTVPLRHPLRWVAAAIVAMIAFTVLHSVVTNPRFEWAVVWHYAFSRPIIAGLEVTLELTAISMTGAVLLGLVIALMRLSPNPILRGAAWSYVWVFRATPLLVQIVIWYNIAALYPRVMVGLPFGPSFDLGININRTITPYLAACLGLCLNEAAYMAEIIRSGLIVVEEGQVGAATALGLSRRQTMFYVVLPQAMRMIVPPTGSQTIGMLKNTSIVSFVAVADLLYAAQIIYSQNFETIPLLIMASLWYLVLTSVLSVGQHYLERRFGRGSRTLG